MADALKSVQRFPGGRRSVPVLSPRAKTAGQSPRNWRNQGLDGWRLHILAAQGAGAGNLALRVLLRDPDELEVIFFGALLQFVQALLGRQPFLGVDLVVHGAYDAQDGSPAVHTHPRRPGTFFEDDAARVMAGDAPDYRFRRRIFRVTCNAQQPNRTCQNANRT